uniref:Nitronate monooxygenase domain-containing protein n=1 Tax=Helicotheca tamesis TaxID=374047 RepID=A0A7S2GYV8_9STRA|mmetsp:Transcript_13538/g.18573  ORF Transcript_13538/g.18573 Transcript_13538/m.18573 type:complete len:370 (+) Transcript_13538:199-1308(+)|eukprot:CAMPEP_0185740752 /NCGR_PEP_ID=MMETSP1171-20130828/38542_1 /TAXON_ID=374046 /ORGANISM="Helicotheca tamensis, Strain CCMP826" /LENGTH=369 /DNA_ID=CAMNT_0028412673 /DNA_START=135 /DNA_END=1244 /DNA_ORIENTATION=-
MSTTAATKFPAIKNRITSLLGCQYPLILPGMSWISTAELVAAVSNAGGVGILATGPLSAEETRSSIKRIRSLAPNKPFGIGATLLMPGSTENAKVALEEKVPLINTSLGKADWIAEAAHEYGGKVLCTVTNAKHAESAITSGADAIMATGHEAAAHGGDVTSLVLIPSLAERFPDVPIVAAGGFANGKGVAAALSLGADGIAMGSRLAMTKESPLASNVKEVISSSDVNGGATESDTIYGKNFDGIPARVLRSPASVRLNAKPASFPVVFYRAMQAAKAMDMPLWKVLPGLITQWDKMYVVAQFGAATEALMAATVDGTLEDTGVQFIGQCQGLIGDVPVVDDLVQRIMREAHMVSSSSASLFTIDEER